MKHFLSKNELSLIWSTHCTILFTNYKIFVTVNVIPFFMYSSRNSMSPKRAMLNQLSNNFSILFWVFWLWVTRTQKVSISIMSLIRLIEISARHLSANLYIFLYTIKPQSLNNLVLSTSTLIFTKCARKLRSCVIFCQAFW